MNAARQLALQGDIAGAAAAALEQAGSYDEFMEMEMYQKEAIAKAAGTTVDQLVKSGQLQKMSVALGGKEIKNMSELTEADRQALVASGDLNEDEAAKLAIQEQQVSQQEKMTQAIDKIKEAFLKIMDGPLGAIVDAFSTILGNAAVMKGIITAIAIAAVPFAVSMAASAISAIGTMSALTLGVTTVDRIEIGENTVVGAGSVVLKSLPDNVLVYGNPAKIIRNRELKEKFLK
jgi:tetrahydrodipicolinate N-succinyltransferase